MAPALGGGIVSRLHHAARLPQPKLSDLGPLPWMERGQCAPADKHYPEGEGSRAEAHNNAIDAKEACLVCPVADQCVAFALQGRETYGIWGGYNMRNPGERRRATEGKPPVVPQRIVIEAPEPVTPPKPTPPLAPKARPKVKEKPVDIGPMFDRSSPTSQGGQIADRLLDAQPGSALVVSATRREAATAGQNARRRLEAHGLPSWRTRWRRHTPPNPDPDFAHIYEVTLVNLAQKEMHND